MITVRTNAQTKKVLLAIGRMPEDFRQGIEEGFQEYGANLVRTSQNQILNEPKFGREYRIRDDDGVTRLHRASAPKQTPALISGEYFEGFGYNSRKTELEFGNEAEHAEYLEDGTPNMEARPGLRNSIDSTVRNFRSYVTDRIDRNLQS